MKSIHIEIALLMPTLISCQTGYHMQQAIDHANEYYNKHRERLPTVVRLAFHSCHGTEGCNGCLNMNNVDNGGLGGAYQEINDYYDTLSKPHEFSRADYWNVFYVEALNRIYPEGSGDKFDITHTVGRRDCGESPHESNMWKYPNPRGGWEEVKRQFGENSEYGFTAREIVALIGGAHSMGDCSLENSGFEHPWDLTIFTADANYVRQMGRDQFYSRENAAGNHQWYRNSDEDNNVPDVMMNLNTDFALIKNFTIADESTGEVSDSCKTDSRNCKDNQETVGLFERYQEQGVGNENLFVDFVEVYYKMLNKGYSENEIFLAPKPEREPSSSSGRVTNVLFFLGVLSVLIN